MMTPYRTPAAKRNLRAGIKKMEKTMTPAAQVRREFQLGRPPRRLAEGKIPEPLHPVVAWQRATDALADFRRRMVAAGLKPEHAEALVVYVQRADLDTPHVLLLERNGEAASEMRRTALETLGREDVITLGMIFQQYDEQTGQRSIFPRLYFGLNERGMDVLKRAAEMQFRAGEVLKQAH